MRYICAIVQILKNQQPYSIIVMLEQELQGLRHNCGIVVAHTLHDVYSFGKALQHRGREAAGIAAIGYDRIDVAKWKGTVDRFDVTDLFKIFPGHQYHTYLMHIRYATRGRKDQILEDAHPHTIGGTQYDYGDHRFIMDCEAVIVHNGQVEDQYLQGIDLSDVKTGCDTEKILHYIVNHGARGFLKDVPGSFTLAMADKRHKDVIVCRDKTGIKPGVLGWKDGKYVAASESIAFDKNGAEFREDLEPGSIYYMHPQGNYTRQHVVDEILKLCYFEYNYVAHMASILGGVNVRVVRQLMGEALAEEHKLEDVDIVSYMPRCPQPAARTMAQKLNKRFEYIFYKTQGSTLEERAQSISSNLFLMPGVEAKIKDKTVAVVDDSIIRGNNAMHIKHLLYDIAKVKKAYMVSYTPPVGIVGEDGVPRGCTFGVDMPPDDKFIARDRTMNEISAKMGMPVKYLSINGMLKIFERLGIPKEKLCYFCVGGEHPFKDIPENK